MVSNFLHGANVLSVTVCHSIELALSGFVFNTFVAKLGALNHCAGSSD